MAEISRTSQAEWRGDSREGSGMITSESGALKQTEYTYSTRFGNAPGTNPEELIAAAHAACFTMAFAGRLKKNGYQPAYLSTRSVCFVNEKPGGGHEITHLEAEVLGTVPGIDEETFKRIAEEADQNCPVSNLLRPGMKITFDASLIKHQPTSV